MNRLLRYCHHVGTIAMPLWKKSTATNKEEGLGKQECKEESTSTVQGAAGAKEEIQIIASIARAETNEAGEYGPPRDPRAITSSPTCSLARPSVKPTGGQSCAKHLYSVFYA